MKLFTAFVLSFIASFGGISGDETSEYFTTIECSSSGMTCLKPYCYLNQLGKANNSINFGCDLKRKLHQIFFRDQIFKYEVNAYEWITDRTINFCFVTENWEGDDAQYVMELTFSGLIQPCPYSDIRVINGSRLKTNNIQTPGKYKTITTIMDDSDDKIFEVIYYEEFKSSN